MTERADGRTGGVALTAEQVLDEVQLIAALEHAHCVYHLRLHSALDGHAAEGDDQVPAAIRQASAAAYLIAQSDMIHLRNVNRVLVKGGRPPTLDRAMQVTSASGSDIDLMPMTASEFARFPEREKALAAALDHAYTGLRDAVEVPPTPSLPDGVLEELQGVLDLAVGPGMDHGSRLPAVVEPLARLSPTDYLRVTGVEAVDELDRRLLALSDEFYGSLLGILREHLADVDGEAFWLRQEALSRMDDLHKVNGLLGLRGLIAPFTAP
jgi:hypothetical protein